MANKLALIVDDSRVARLTLNKILLGHGLSVIEQDSAEAALQWLASQQELPDVIFMDLMMPGMDGITATRQIKNNPELQSIPVVVCTGNDSEIDKSQATASGAIAVLAKPPATDTVAQILGNLPQRSALQASPQQAEPVSAAFDETALLARLEQQLEQQWLPQLRSEISKQLAAQPRQTADQQPADLEALKLSLLPDLKQTLQQTVNAALTELRQRAASDNSNMQQQAASILEQAFQGFDVIGQWQNRLQEQAQGWLAKQKLDAEDALTQSLTPLIDEKIRQQVSAELSKQLQTELSQQNAALTSQLQSQRAELEIAQKRNITLAWAAIGIALAALIISVI